MLAPLVVLFAGVGLIKRAAAPRLQLPPFALHVAADTPDSVVPASFILANVGGAPLSVELTSECGCTALSPRKAVIEPGGTQEVQLRVRVPEAYGAERSISVTIASNDPANALDRYFISARCRAPFSVSASSIEFGNIPEGARRKAVVLVKRSEDAHGVLPAAYSISGPQFELTEEQRSNDELRLAVSPARFLARGFHHALLKFPIDDEHTIEVSVAATICGEISVAPIYLELRPALESGKAEGQFLLRRYDRAPLGAPVRIEAPAGWSVKSLSAEPAPIQRFRVEAPLGREKDVPVRLDFDGDQVAEVHVGMDATSAAAPTANSGSKVESGQAPHASGKSRGERS